jgi:hypothetical protein
MADEVNSRDFFEKGVMAEMDSLYGTALRLTRNSG